MTEPDASSSSADGGGNPNDPSGFVTSPPSTMVKVINTARAEINESIGMVLSYNRERGRYNVSLLPGQSSASAAAGNAASARAAGGAHSMSVMSFKPENLTAASAIEKAKAQGLVAIDRLKRMAADPNVREQVRRAYTSVQARLPPGVKPEYVGVALMVLWWMSVWFFGFSKTVMVTSISGLIVSVCLQDILAGSDAKTIVQKFPGRWRQAVVQSTGFSRVTEKQALAGFVIVMLLSAKVVMTPALKRAPKAPTAASAAIPPDPAGQQSRNLKAPSFNIEEIYKMGFNDAKDGKDYGTSMPDPTEFAAAASSADAVSAARGVDYDPREWDLNPPPPPEGKQSKFGFGTIMAAFTLFRFGKEIAINPDGHFDQQMAMANLNLMPKWKLGIVALSLYRVVSVLF
uniref:Uncharacterized protein n=1 Tax=Odontella aurita TaxID=265563 RepID=A0A7S4HRJ6_9STRA|mmetsp:Transcript_14117/g.41422  ORF Transcript_14117/g.41422 Transcript_14117/m.41422 type:complete len:402 (+) Transcript_14117:303-1508(+)